MLVALLSIFHAFELNSPHLSHVVHCFTIFRLSHRQCIPIQQLLLMETVSLAENF